MYSYVIEIADSEYQLRLHDKALVSEILAFYHLLENARGRPDVVVMYTLVKSFKMFLRVLKVFEDFEGFLRI